MKTKEIPTDWEIDQDQIIDDLLFEITKSKDPLLKDKNDNKKIKLSRKSIKVIMKLLQEIIEYYLRNWDCSEGKIIVKPFRGLRLFAYDEDAEDATNKLTGEQYHKSARRRYGAYFSRYWQRTWNNLAP